MAHIIDLKTKVTRIQEMTGSLASCANELLKSKSFQDTFNEEIRKAQKLLDQKEQELLKQLSSLEEFRGKTVDDHFSSSAKRLRTEEMSKMSELMGEEH
jgi:hypothetical protein